MYRVFSTIIDMSIVSSFVILAVLLIRLVLRWAPKRFSYVLWAVVLLRLLCPFAVESPLSLIPERAGTVARSAVLSGAEQVNFVSTVSDAYRAIGDTANGGLDLIPVETDPGILQQTGKEAWEQHLTATHRQVWLLCVWLWPTGAVAVAVWGICGHIRLHRRLVGAVRVKDNVWLADHISTAFVMGLLRPRIYLPSNIGGPGVDYVLEHERTHIRRGDHIFRLLAFTALALHWFNPMVWLAFALSGRDMEMSCDEAVMRRSESDIRANYCQTLLNMSANRTFPCPSPLAFGEGDTSARIKNALRWKRPAKRVVVAAVVVIVLSGVLLLTNPLTNDSGTVEPLEIVVVVPGYYYEDGVLDYCTSFSTLITLPEGWSVTSEESAAPYSANTYGMHRMVYMYGEDGGYAGFIAWRELERLYEVNHYLWEDHAQVVSGETEVYTASIIYDEFDESLLPGHPWRTFETLGIRAENEELGVYVCVQFAPGAVDEEELALVAGSLGLSGFAQSQ